MTELHGLTAEQIDLLVYAIGEDEARTLVYRMIIPLNEADALIAYDEAIWWITEEDDDANNQYEDEPDEPEEPEIITDSNGQTQQAFTYNGVNYIIWNREEVRTLDGVVVGSYVDGLFVLTI